jgi:hypothetical protein
MVYMMMNNYLKWVATVITLAGALCTSFRVDPLNIYLLNTGSMLFLIWSIRIKDSAMIAVNTGLLLIYFIGIIK